MMLGGKNPKSLEKSLDQYVDRIGLEVLQAVKVSEEEVEEAASSPDLYDRLRLRIAAGRRERAAERELADDWHPPARTGLHFIPALLGARRSSLWTLAAAAILLLLVAATLLWPKPSPGPGQIAQPALQQAPPSTPREAEAPTAPSNPDREGLAVLRSTPEHSRYKARRHQATLPANSHAGEVATEFLPVTYVADSTVLESGHVVRVRVPRSALISFGVPVNVERAGELVKADVLIGDDGLARAIRFVQ